MLNSLDQMAFECLVIDKTDSICSSCIQPKFTLLHSQSSHFTLKSYVNLASLLDASLIRFPFWCPNNHYILAHRDYAKARSLWKALKKTHFEIYTHIILHLHTSPENISLACLKFEQIRWHNLGSNHGCLQVCIAFLKSMCLFT